MEEKGFFSKQAHNRVESEMFKRWELFDYLRKEAKDQHTEFRLVVQSNGDCYIHVLGKDSATFDFKL